MSILYFTIVYPGSSNSSPLWANFLFSLGATLEPLLWRDSGNMLLLMLSSAKASSPYAPALAALSCALLHSGVVATAESAGSKNDKGCYQVENGWDRKCCRTANLKYKTLGAIGANTFQYKLGDFRQKLFSASCWGSSAAFADLGSMLLHVLLFLFDIYESQLHDRWKPSLSA